MIFEGKSNEVRSFIWSTLVFLLNGYILFSVILWVSVDGLPSGNALFVEIVIEILLLSEFLIRILLGLFNKEVLYGLQLYHVRMKDGFIRLFVLFLGTIPQLTIYYLLNAYIEAIDLFDQVYSFLLAIKLLRVYELSRYIDKVQEKLFYRTTKALILIKFLVNISLILLITHAATSAFLFVEKTHPRSHGPQPYSKNLLNPFREGKFLNSRLKL